MDVTIANLALERLARQEGVSIETVRHEIEIAIIEALENTDPKVQTFWKSVPHKGEYPTPEEAIAYIAGMTKNS